jgi:predicted nucleic acid-binding protein
MIKWKRPSGTYIETNDSAATIELAASLGWVQVKEPKKRNTNKAKGDNNDNGETNS